MRLHSRSAFVLAALVAGTAGWQLGDRSVPRLSAGESQPFDDTDGDLLPDSVERILLTNPSSADSDGDGTGDFLEAARFEAARGLMPAAPLDHEMRFAVSATSGQVLMNLMMRVVPGEDVKALVPFIEFNGVRQPIAELFWNHLVHVDVLSHPTEGLYVFASSWLCTTEQLKTILPCAIGTVGVVGGKDFLNGSSLLEIDEVAACVVQMPMGLDGTFAFQSLDDQEPLAPGGGGSTFWQRAKACEMRLEPVGGGGGSSVTQVQDARCKGAPTMSCAPSCGESTGRFIVVPNGLPYLTGN